MAALNIREEETSTIRALLLKNKTGRIPAEILNLIYKNKLFKLFVPQEYNGLNLTVPEGIKAIEECSAIDGDFGWAICIGAGGGYFAPYFEKETAVRLFNNQNAVVAGSGNPTGTATPLNNGWIISGKWRFCSGAEYASVFTFNALEDADPDKVITFFAFPGEVSISKDWNTLGLQNTESHTIEIKEFFITKERIFSLNEIIINFKDNIAGYPFLPFAKFSFAFVVSGILNHFLEVAAELVEPKQIIWNRYPERFIRTENLIIEYQKEHEENRDKYFKLVSQSWQEFLILNTVTKDTEEEIISFTTSFTKKCMDISTKVMFELGISAQDKDSAINKIWRDLWTASQHVLLKDYNLNYPLHRLKS